MSNEGHNETCVALDAMGGDHGPSVVIPAAAVALIGGLGGALALSGAAILTYYAVAHLAAWRRWPPWGARVVAGIGLVGCLGIATTLVALTLL